MATATATSSSAASPQAYRVRVLRLEKYARTHLAETARDFCDKVAQLLDTVATVVDAVDRQVRLASSAGVAETNETPYWYVGCFREGRVGRRSDYTFRPRRLPVARDGAACSARSDETRVAYRPRDGFSR